MCKERPKNANKSAFPVDYDAIESHSGITKREHFAGIFLQGMLSNPEIFNRGCAKSHDINNADVGDILIDDAIETADSFLSRLESLKEK